MTFLPPIAGPFDKLIEYKHDIEKENKRLKEENERYRKALDNLIHLSDTMWLERNLPGQHHPVIEEAREALKQK